MSTAMYRRYRSATFADLIGQGHIATTLRNQVMQDKVSHGYLFTGMRGTGKTSTARILARAVNCQSLRDGEPCNQCTPCIDITEGTTVDVLEIDAASNRGIDEMRDLRDKVKFLPASLTRKVYIVDEAHMLTNEAWNALLKTLEEPPDHVIFILATTEPQKIPETVRSRVQRFDFRPVDSDDLTKHLTQVAGEEQLTLDPDAGQILARASQGSVRDALSLMEQAAGGAEGHITVERVRAALGYADVEVLRRLMTGLAGDDAAIALDALAAGVDNGADPRQLLRDVGRVARGAVLACIGYQSPSAADLDQALASEVAGLRGDPRWWLDALDRVAATELALRQPVDARLQVEQCILHIACQQTKISSVSAVAAPSAPVAAPQSVTPAPQVVSAPSMAKPDPVPNPTPAPDPPPAAPVQPRDGTEISNVEEWVAAWPRLIEAVNRRKEVSLAGVLRDCRPLDCSDEALTIGALYAFHLERLKDADKLAVLAQAVEEVGGKPRSVTAVFSGKGENAEKAASSNSDKELTEAVLETFGGSRITGSRIRDRDRGDGNS